MGGAELGEGQPSGGMYVLATGAVVLAVAILASLTGVAKGLLYDRNAGSARVEGVGSPLSYTASIDANAKHIRDGTAAYLAHLNAVDAASDHITALAGSTAQMTTSIGALSAGLALVLRRSQAIDRGLRGLGTTAGAAGTSLGGVGADSARIAALMTQLRSATDGLGGTVRAIDTTASGIAGTQLPAALDATRAIDALLPMGVPPARSESGP
jgi:hypothetical protein